MLGSLGNETHYESGNTGKRKRQSNAAETGPDKRSHFVGVLFLDLEDQHYDSALAALSAITHSACQRPAESAIAHLCYSG